MSEGEGGFSRRLLPRLFIAQKQRPGHLGEIDLGALTPFERGLLVIVGLVTQFIEAHQLESVDVEQVSQERIVLDGDQPWLEAFSGDPVASRSVLLTGAVSGRVYVHGQALMVEERLPPGLRIALARPDLGIGRALRRERIELYGDLLWCGMEQVDLPGLPADRPVVSRTYRFVTAGTPSMLITERFAPRGNS